MRCGKHLQQNRLHSLTGRLVVTAMIFLIVTTGAAQEVGTGTVERSPSQELSAYPGLLPEFSQLFQKIQDRVQLPPPRSRSRLLPLLPQSTVFYAAFPNLGDASHQAWAIFQKELQQNPTLRTLWQQGGAASNGPMIESSLGKFYELSQYLGDEVVISGASEAGAKDPALLIVAEVEKPGLKEFLQHAEEELAGKSQPPRIRIVSARELATLRDKAGPPQLLILVRSDFVAGSLKAATLRSFNAQLDRNGGQFASTSFGERLTRAYQGEGGISAAGGIDLQKIIGERPRSAAQSEAAFRGSGFSDVKYLIWEHKNVAGHAVNQMELSFTGPRHGAASWLASPGPLGGMDFVSPQAIVASTLRLKSPAQIFDDVKELSTLSNPNAFAALDRMELIMRTGLRNDLLNYLTGEITFEVEGAEPRTPKWTAVLGLSNPARLQATFGALLAQMPLRAQQFEENGITYHTLDIPAGNKPTEIGYAFVDSYLVIASSQEEVAEAVRLHRSGSSLAKSKKFLSALPPGHGSAASAIFYEDPVAMAAMNMRRISPGMADSFSKIESSPSVICAYGDESAIREASKSGGVDAGVVFMAAAIAIPNLLRAQMAANESSAVAIVRTIDTAETTYSAAYPTAGYARDLARLGPDPRNMKAFSGGHAGLIDATLGNPDCTEGAWCSKSGYRFSISAVCKKEKCDEFVAVGTPFSSSKGTRSFCSTSDGVVRYRAGAPLLAPVSVEECRAWPPLQQ